MSTHCPDCGTGRAADHVKCTHCGGTNPAVPTRPWAELAMAFALAGLCGFLAAGFLFAALPRTFAGYATTFVSGCLLTAAAMWSWGCFEREQP